MARAGRPEQPLPEYASGPLPQLARELRQRRGTVPYRELADRTGLSAATLRAAARGEHLPSWAVTRAFIAACGGDESTARRLWERACAAEGRPVPASAPSAPPVPNPGEVKNAAGLVSMLQDLRLWAGDPSLSELNKRAGGHNLLPPSTVSDMLRSQRLPRLELLSAFVHACGLDDAQAAAWERSWAELREQDLVLASSLDNEAAPPRPVASDWVTSREAPYGPRSWAVLVDLACGAAGALAGAWLRFGTDVTWQYIVLSLALAGLWVAGLGLSGGYDVRFLGAGSDEFRKVFRTGLTLLAVAGFLSWAFRADVSRGYLFIAVSGMTALDMAARQLRRRRLHRLRAMGRRMLTVVAAGHEADVAVLISELRREVYHGLSVVAACVPLPTSTREVSGVPVLGGLEEVPLVVRRCAADTVVVLACPEMTGIRLRQLAWTLERTGTELCVAPALLDVAGPRTTIRPVAGLTIVHVDHPQLDGWQRVTKSVFDRCVAALALTLLAPMLLSLAVAIRLSDHGPALFTQTRIGKDGQPFKIYKFRTMFMDAEQRSADLRASDDLGGVLFKIRRDPRITPIGTRMRRWSLDELPQLINVLRGDMSLVGPRPALPEEAEKYADHVRRRLTVKPGLTGLWQVSGRSDLSWDESVRLDLRYVENWSLIVDLQILWKTISVFMRGSGAY
jgi:exopolysaccharide biosynthesis polyprenyl glycosylphosphotransferase